MHNFIRALGTAILTPLRFSINTGHFLSSVYRTSRSSNGAPLPWYTYPAIDFLSARKFDGRDILEFGGGQSTLWWSERSKSVLTIEENFTWFNDLVSRVTGNVKVKYVSVDLKSRSTEAVERELLTCGIGKFDVIIIDGHLRRELVKLSLKFISKDGCLIFDNSEGYGFYEEIKYSGLQKIDFYGFAPGVSKRHCTSMLYNEQCFLLSSSIPIVSLDPG